MLVLSYGRRLMVARCCCRFLPARTLPLRAGKARGAPLLDEKPRPGAGGARVAFVHPKGSRGVLVELRQGPESP